MLRLKGGGFAVDIHGSLGELFGSAEFRSINGCLVYDKRKQAFTRFDLALLGDTKHKNGQAVQGGLFFELGEAKTPFESLPPSRHAFGGISRYFATAK